MGFFSGVAEGLQKTKKKKETKSTSTNKVSGGSSKTASTAYDIAKRASEDMPSKYRTKRGDTSKVGNGKDRD